MKIRAPWAHGRTIKTAGHAGVNAAMPPEQASEQATQAGWGGRGQPSENNQISIVTQYSQQLAFQEDFRRRTHHLFCDSRPMSGTSNEYDDASVPE